MKEILSYLDGKKTYLSALGLIMATLLVQYGYIDETQYWNVAGVLAGLTAIFLRLGISSLVPDAKVEIPTPDPIKPADTTPDIKSLIETAVRDIVNEQKKPE